MEVEINRYKRVFDSERRLCSLSGCLQLRSIPSLWSSSEAAGCRGKPVTTSNRETWCSPRWRASLTGLPGCAHTYTQTHKNTHIHSYIIYFCALTDVIFLFVCVQVCKSEDGYKKRVPVFFFGTHQMYVHTAADQWHDFPHKLSAALIELWLISSPPLRGHLLPENIVPYVGNKMKYGSGVRIKGFSEGMWEIQNTPGVGSKLKVSVSLSNVSADVRSLQPLWH